MADAARRVCAAVPDTMVVVDADTGYGNAVNVVRTVELWEQAGAAGLFLEDQVWPKRCGHMAGKQVVDRDEWLAKLRAALDHRRHLHVTARTDARAPLGLDEAIDRARRAADLGVDAVFVEAPESIARARADRRRPAGRHPRGQHGRVGSHAAAHAGRAARPRLRPDRVAAVGSPVRHRRARRRLPPSRGRGHAPRPPRRSDVVRRLHRDRRASTRSAPSTPATNPESGARS